MKWEILVFITGVSIVLLSIAVDDKLPEGTGDVMFRGAVIVVFGFCVMGRWIKKKLTRGTNTRSSRTARNSN
jgi:hypothetical protein